MLDGCCATAVPEEPSTPFPGDAHTLGLLLSHGTLGTVSPGTHGRGLELHDT